MLFIIGKNKRFVNNMYVDSDDFICDYEIYFSIRLQPLTASFNSSFFLFSSDGCPFFVAYWLPWAWCSRPSSCRGLPGAVGCTSSAAFGEFVGIADWTSASFLCSRSFRR
jgi:hypothetical protein